jgi:hypothetical protein
VLICVRDIGDGLRYRGMGIGLRWLMGIMFLGLVSLFVL